MNPDMHRRNMRYAAVRGTQFSTRADEGTQDIYVEGYFSVYDSPYELWPGAEEIIKPGAFAESIHDDVRALTNHDTTLVLGRSTAGTLVLRDDPDKGLWGSIKINRDDGDAMNLYARVQRGDVDQCSFGFEIEKETFIDLGGGRCRWEIEKVKPLYEVSVCTFPAYKETSVSARKRDLEEIERRRAEAWRQQTKLRLEAIKHGA